MTSSERFCRTSPFCRLGDSGVFLMFLLYWCTELSCVRCTLDMSEAFLLSTGVSVQMFLAHPSPLCWKLQKNYELASRKTSKVGWLVGTLVGARLLFTWLDCPSRASRLFTDDLALENRIWHEGCHVGLAWRFFANCSHIWRKTPLSYTFAGAEKCSENSQSHPVRHLDHGRLRSSLDQVSWTTSTDGTPPTGTATLNF